MVLSWYLDIAKLKKYKIWITSLSMYHTLIYVLLVTAVNSFQIICWNLAKNAVDINWWCYISWSL